MHVKSIKTDRAYRRALRQIDKLMEARPGTADGSRLDMLAKLVEAWEHNHYAIDAPDPIERE